MSTSSPFSRWSAGDRRRSMIVAGQARALRDRDHHPRRDPERDRRGVHPRDPDHVQLHEDEGEHDPVALITTPTHPRKPPPLRPVAPTRAPVSASFAPAARYPAPGTRSLRNDRPETRIHGCAVSRPARGPGGRPAAPRTPALTHAPVPRDATRTTRTRPEAQHPAQRSRHGRCARTAGPRPGRRLVRRPRPAHPLCRPVRGPPSAPFAPGARHPPSRARSLRNHHPGTGIHGWRRLAAGMRRLAARRGPSRRSAAPRTPPLTHGPGAAGSTRTTRTRPRGATSCTTFPPWSIRTDCRPATLVAAPGAAGGSWCGRRRSWRRRTRSAAPGAVGKDRRAALLPAPRRLPPLPGPPTHCLAALD